MFRSLSILAILFIFVSPACAAPTTPHAIAEVLYNSYLADPHANDLANHKVSAKDIVLHYADLNLKKAINADDACEMRTREVCAIDADVLINGQDWDISDFRIVDEAKVSGHQTIRALFNNGGSNRVSFYFVRRGEVWKIHDVTAEALSLDGKVKMKWSLLKTLSSK